MIKRRDFSTCLLTPKTLHSGLWIWCIEYVENLPSSYELSQRHQFPATDGSLQGLETAEVSSSWCC